MEGVIGGSWVCLLVLERDSGCRLPDTVALRAYVLGRGWEGAGLDHTVVVPPERLGNKVGQLTGGLRGQPGGPVQKAAAREGSPSERLRRPLCGFTVGGASLRRSRSAGS
jgi:hypothetical protein